MTTASRHITASIQASPEQVYAFASDPANLPLWASGLSSAMHKDGEQWTAESPMGTVKVQFASKNNFGVLDHAVTLPDGRTIMNPLRVLSNHSGSEVIFTLFRTPGMSEADFERDAETVTKDLRKLKAVIESM